MHSKPAGSDSPRTGSNSIGLQPLCQQAMSATRSLTHFTAPGYLPGQDSWYAAGLVAVLMVDSNYSGPLLVRPFQLADDGKATVTLADLPPTDVIKQEPRVTVVPALHTTGGGLYLGPVMPTSS